jgi:hypothetical protein
VKDFIHAHRFADLHNGDQIIYSIANIENIHSAFNQIKNNPKPVILITANADLTIDDYLVNSAPQNLHRWFAQNGTSSNPKLTIIPEGLQPSYQSKTGDIGYPIASVKENILSSLPEITPTKFIYANFAVGTNPSFRQPVKDLCSNIEFIDWDENINFSSYESYNNENTIKYFYEKIKDYRATVCPIGNGLDTHRVYETLYCGRIPITFNKILHHKLYQHYPIVLLERVEDLSNYELLDSLITKEENKIWDKNLLDFSYWEKLIIDELNKIKI